MLDRDTMRAIGMMMARQARQRATAEDTSANETIDLAPLLRPWAPGPWAAGEVCAHEGAPYRCIEPGHDSTDNPDWTPDKTPALWAPYHATDVSHALPWHKPTGAHDMYKQGEWMIWTDGVPWQCVEDTSYSPEEWPQAWEVSA